MKTTAMKKTVKKGNLKTVANNSKSNVKHAIVSDMGIGFRILDFKS